MRTINTVLWLFNVSWQIAVLPQFKRHINWSSFHIYFKAQNKHEWTSEHILFQPRKDINAHSLSPLNLIYSPVWFVCQKKWWIRHYDWSDRLSVKLFAKGQLRWISWFLVYHTIKQLNAIKLYSELVFSSVRESYLVREGCHSSRPCRNSTFVCIKQGKWVQGSRVVSNHPPRLVNQLRRQPKPHPPQVSHPLVT